MKPILFFFGISIVFTFTTCHKKHLDFTDPWQRLISPFDGQLLSTQFVNDTGFILGLNTQIGNRYNELLQTTDRGNTWHTQRFAEPEPGGVGLLFVYNSHLMFASKDGIFKSIDGGASWEATDTTYNSILNLTNGIYFIDTEDGVTIMGSSVYKTIDGGRTFNEVFYDSSASTLKQLQFVSANKGFVRGGDLLSNSTLILKTTDRGNTWQKIAFNYGFINSMFFVNENIGYSLVTQNIYKTKDGGNTWIKENDQPVGENNGGKLFFINENEGFLVTAYGEIFYTSSDGKSWILEHSESGLQLNDITADKNNNVFVVGQNGLILFRNHH